MHAVDQNGLFFSGRLLSSLHCHWLVDGADARGFLKVVRLAEGPFFFVHGSRQRGGSEKVVCCGG